MYEYRFRAECRGDIEVLMSEIPEAIYVIRDLAKDVPDVEVDMSCQYDLDAIKKKLEGNLNFDLILKTINYQADYKDTFENDYKSSLN